MGKGAIAIGAILIVFGIFLILLSNFNVVGLIYGLLAIAIGIGLIVFWREESKIEERKDLKSKK